MDHFSAWINNNQLLNQLNSSNLDELQDDIIENVFGGFGNILKYMMKTYNTLSFVKHMELYNVLLTKHNGDIYDNYRNQNNDDNKLCVAHISDDCLSYIIMQFLNNCDRLSIQQTCRLFTVISRQESSFKKTIINGLLSDDKQSNLESICSLQLAPNYCYLDIKNYSNILSIKMQNIIRNNLLTNKYCLELFMYELSSDFNKSLLPFISIILNNSLCKENENDPKYVTQILETLSIHFKRNIFDIMNCDQLISSLFLVLSNLNKYTLKTRKHAKKSIFGDTDSEEDDDFFNLNSSYGTKQKLVGCGCEILRKIYESGYTSYRIILLQKGIISLLKLLLDDNIRFNAIYAVFTSIFKKPTKDEMNLIINDEEILQTLTSKEIVSIRDYGEIIINIIKNANSSQRRKLINSFINNYQNQSIIKHIKYKIMDALKSVNDNELYEEFRYIKSQNNDPFDSDYDDDLDEHQIDPTPTPSVTINAFESNQHHVLPFHFLPKVRDNDKFIDDDELKPWIKMHKIGVPEAAIRLKMGLAGFNDDVIDRIIIQNEDNGLGLSNIPHSMKASMLLLDDGMDTDSDSSGCWNSDDIHPESEVDEYEVWRKMIRFGVPQNAVRHKMIIDGYTSDAFDIYVKPEQKENDEDIFGENDKNIMPPPPPPITKRITILETLEHYAKMLKVGVPEATVKNKLLMNDFEEHLVNQLFKDEKDRSTLYYKGDNLFDDSSDCDDLFEAQRSSYGGRGRLKLLESIRKSHELSNAYHIQQHPSQNDKKPLGLMDIIKAKLKARSNSMETSVTNKNIINDDLGFLFDD